MKIESASIPGKCESCRGDGVYEVAQVLHDGFIEWEVEFKCSACQEQYAERGLGAGSDWLRDALKKENGEWGVVAESFSRPKAMKVFRSIYENSLAEAKMMADRLAGAGINGTHIESEFLAMRLRAYDGASEVKVVKVS